MWPAGLKVSEIREERVLFSLNAMSLIYKNETLTENTQPKNYDSLFIISFFRHDDYDYSQINHLLDRNLKLFLKTVSCYPERLACPTSPETDLATVMKGFLMSEKVYICGSLLCAEILNYHFTYKIVVFFCI